MLRVSDLRNGERLLILRRRKGTTKAQAARKFKVTLYKYNRWESDVEQGPKRHVSKLAYFEQSLLMRLRAGASVAKFARILKVSAWWLRQMEIGKVSDGRLRSYWKAR